MLFGRQPLCRLELPPRRRRSPNFTAPSGNRTRALRLGKAAFWATELPARRRHVQEWVREDSNLHDRYFTPALCPLSYRPVSPSEAPPAGLAPATSCVTSKRSGCLSYGGVTVASSVVKEHTHQTSVSGGWRIRTSAGPLGPRALAPRCIGPLCQPSGSMRFTRTRSQKRRV